MYFYISHLLRSYHFYFTFTFYTHPSTQWPIVALSHLCRIYHNTFPYSLFIHFIFTLYSLTTLILQSHSTSFTFSLQSLYLTHIFTFHLYLTYSLSITLPDFTLCSYHFTLISHRDTPFTLLTHFTPSYVTRFSYSS